MGYYSEVAIALKKADWQKMQEEAAAKTDVFGFPFVEMWQEVAERKDGIVVLRFSGKWYRSYQEIQFVENFLDGVEHEFIRVGEEPGDVETDNSFEDRRSIFWTETKIVVEQEW